MGTRAERIQSVLQRELSPHFLRLVDESARHAGHAERNGLAQGETHFALTLVSERFVGMKPIQRHRLVHELLSSEFETGLHALSLTLKTP